MYWNVRKNRCTELLDYKLAQFVERVQKEGKRLHAAFYRDFLMQMTKVCGTSDLYQK